MALATVVPAAHAQTWRITPSIALESTYTDNVALATSGQRSSDWVNQFTPGVRFDGTSAHSKVTGTVSLPLLVYARNSGNNYAAPQASVNGTFEAIDKLLFVDASANVSQQYLSPFGAQPNNLANTTQNRYTAQSYSISPYLKGEAAGGIAYELRQTNTWTDATGVSAGFGTNRSYSSGVTANLARQPSPGGWRFDYSRADLRFQGLVGQDRETTQIGRGYLDYKVDPTLRLSAIGGYENNDFFGVTESGAVFGASAEWRPNDRTTLQARSEHRFFGESYTFGFDHHTPLTVWSIKASRDISSYPAQLANLPAGGDVTALLNALFSSRVPDPTQRQALIDQVIRDRGLPSVLGGPVALYSQQITLIQTQTATFGILGARNTVFFTAYHTRNGPVAGSTSDVLSPLLTLLTNNSQVGANVVWTHQLAANLALGVDGNWSRTSANLGTGGATRLYAMDATITASLSPLTSLSGGLRYQDARSDVASGYRELAVFVGLLHTFR
ncbi:MAG: TIGR03016 family PEP-CTERM system-associated outer membrane protein [Casimicrobiaceae bacterium]